MLSIKANRILIGNDCLNAVGQTSTVVLIEAESSTGSEMTATTVVWLTEDVTVGSTWTSTEAGRVHLADHGRTFSATLFAGAFVVVADVVVGVGISGALGVNFELGCLFGDLVNSGVI